jgi:hypothetical protein
MDTLGLRAAERATYVTKMMTRIALSIKKSEKDFFTPRGSADALLGTAFRLNWQSAA